MGFHPVQGTIFTVLYPNKWICAFRKEQMTTGPFFGSGNPIFFCLEADIQNTANTYVGVQDSVDGSTFQTRYIHPVPLVPGGQLFLDISHYPNYGRLILFSTGNGIVFVERRTFQFLCNPGQVKGGFFPPDDSIIDPNNPNPPDTGPEAEPPQPPDQPPAQCTLTVGFHQDKLSPAGDVIAPGIGVFTYDCGTIVPLIVRTPMWGVLCFDQWLLDTTTIDDPTSAVTTITMDGDYSILALYGWCPGPP